MLRNVAASPSDEAIIVGGMGWLILTLVDFHIPPLSPLLGLPEFLVFGLGGALTLYGTARIFSRS